MAEGQKRRAQPVDNLRGGEALNPVTRNTPSLSRTNTPRTPDTSFTDKIAQQVGQFASGRLRAMQQEQQQRSMMDGQIAAMQGESFENVEMEGDKWALEGYRIVSAQTMASGLLQAQQADIAAGAYEQDPDTYRNNLVNRIEGMTSGIEDDRTRRLARENLMEQAPKLIDEHMKQNAAFREQQNFDALAASVDTMSRDNDSEGDLLDFAMGNSEATASLSTERRRAAVTQGVVNAFTNNNPAAFARLNEAGFINTENLTASQIQKIRTARRSYEARFRQKFNSDHHEKVRDIQERASSGELGPVEAAEKLAAANAEFGLRTGYEQGGQIYEAARKGMEVAQGTRRINIEAAGVEGDYALQAELLQDAVIQQESGGNPFARSSKGAAGLMQLMPGTAMDPGFGVRNVFEVARDMGVPVMGETEAVAQRLMDNPDVNKEMGTEYLSTMLERYDGNVERALVAYNWGPGNADEWNGSRDTLPQETQGYLNNITSSISDDRSDPEGERLAAERRLKQSRERARLSSLEAMAPRMAVNDEKFTRGQISIEEWRNERRSIYEEWGRELDAERINQEQSMIRSVAGQRIADLKQQEEAQKAVQLQSSLAQAEVQLEQQQEAIASGTSDKTIQEINQQYMSSVMEAYEQSGASMDPEEIGQRARDLVLESAELPRRAMEGQEDLAIIQNAEEAGTVGSLPTRLKDRAMKRFDQQLAQNVENFKAENPEASDALIGAMERKARVDYVSRNGIVDSRVQQMINLAASGQGWIKSDGEPNPSVVAGLHSYMSILAENKELAYEYVPDSEARGRISAAAHIVQSKFPGRDIYSDVDLTDKDDPVADAFHDAVKQVGLAQAKPVSEEETQRRVQSAIRSLDEGNIRNTFFGNLFSSSVSDAIVPSDLLTITHTNTNNMIDVEAARRVDKEAVDEQYKTHVSRFLEEVVPHMPATSRDGAVSTALDYVRERGAMMGSSYVMPPSPEPSIRSQMFPGQRVENLASVNTAIVEWMADPEVQEQNPTLADIPNSVFWRGAPEFSVNRINGQYVATIAGHGNIALPLKEIGDRFVANK